MSDKKLIIPVIAGPTASGKTRASINFAKEIGGEIISADSRQIYKYLDIGTAKITKEEANEAVHHFIDICEPDQYYSAGVFGDEAVQKALEISSRGKVPIVCGGSGLYVKALCEGLFKEDMNIDTSQIRANLENHLANEGIDYLYDLLYEIDRASAELYSDKNPRRIVRSLEYFYATGKAFSIAQKEQQIERNIIPVYFGIQWEREDLYERINKRSELMWQTGIIEETKKMLEMGFDPSLNSLNTVGYKETIAFLDGEINADTAVDLIKQNTRRYAKRQMTWFKKYSQMHWIDNKEADMTTNMLKIFENALKSELY